MILSAVACENFLSQLQWDGAAQWRDADRQIWRVQKSDYDVAGYVKQQLPVGKAGLTYVVVREAGHLLPQVRPRASAAIAPHAGAGGQAAHR